MGRRVLEEHGDDGELEHVVVAAWEEIQVRQDAWVNSIGPV